jgi:hypothetical protein
LSWYQVVTPHDHMARGVTVHLDDTPDVELRVTKGHLLAVDTPEWASDEEE